MDTPCVFNFNPTGSKPVLVDVDCGIMNNLHAIQAAGHQSTWSCSGLASDHPTAPVTPIPYLSLRSNDETYTQCLVDSVQASAFSVRIRERKYRDDVIFDYNPRAKSLPVRIPYKGDHNINKSYVSGTDADKIDAWQKLTDLIVNSNCHRPVRTTIQR